MPGRGPQTFKKRQKEQERKERRQEKLAKRLAKKNHPEGQADTGETDASELESPESGEANSEPVPVSDQTH